MREGKIKQKNDKNEHIKIKIIDKEAFDYLLTRVILSLLKAIIKQIRHILAQ